MDTSTQLLDRLTEGLPDGTVFTDPDRMASYRRDMATFCPDGAPAVVIRPTETAHVQHVLRVASQLRVPVVPQGARTGLSGAANAIDGCVVLSMERMNRVVEIDVPNRLAVVEPGVVNADLSKQVTDVGLFYPPDPSSWDLSTIGGNLATNAGGLCCVKYGVTADFVRGLEVVLASGDLLSTGRRTVKGVAGYDLTRLFVGSEGTLGVITRATLALRTKAPEARTVAGLFPSVHAAGKAVAEVMTAGHTPSLLEFLDQRSLRAANEYQPMGLPEHAAAMLIAQSDSGSAEHDVQRYAEIFERADGFDIVVAEDAAEGELLLSARRQIHFALEALGTRLIDDVCVPLDRLAEFVQRVEDAAAGSGLTCVVVGHAGDGNLHPNVFFDPDDPAEVGRAEELFAEIMGIGLELGGTITGEHGVGLLKREWLARELGDVSVRVHRQLAKVFDPLGILNPGKVLA